MWDQNTFAAAGAAVAAAFKSVGHQVLDHIVLGEPDLHAEHRHVTELEPALRQHVAVLCAVCLWFALPDTPQSVGLPEVEGSRIKAVNHKADNWRSILVHYVFANPRIWLLAIANFFIYTIRYAVLNWGPDIFVPAKTSPTATRRLDRWRI